MKIIIKFSWEIYRAGFLVDVQIVDCQQLFYEDSMQSAPNCHRNPENFKFHAKWDAHKKYIWHSKTTQS